MRSAHALLAAVLIGTPTASHATPPSLAIIGSGGSGPGQFSSPFGLVEDQAHLFVADYGNQRIQVLTGNDRIQVFEPDGSLVSAWGSSGTGPGQMEGPVAVAIDAGGRCYVLERQNHRIQVFGSITTGVEGRTRGRIALAPDPSRGPVTIRVETPVDDVELSIVDLGGRCVGRWRLSGRIGTFVWDGTDHSGRRVPSGTYFAKLVAGGAVFSRPFRIVR